MDVRDALIVPIPGAPDLLPPHDRVLPLLQTPLYFILLAVNTGVCMAVNGMLDYLMNRDKAEYAIYAGNTTGTIFAFCFIIANILFWSGGLIQQRIKAGRLRGVTQEALCDSFPKRILFATAQADWKRRLPLFLWQSLLIPALPILAFTLAMCYANNTGGIDKCTVSQGIQVLVTEVWKGMATAFIFTCNFVACHNINQPQVRPEDLGGWHTGVCQCNLDGPGSADVFFCEPCQMARQCNRTHKGDPTIHLPLCVSLTACPVAMFPVGWYMRQRIRQRYDIRGEACEDGCFTFFATPCVLCQNYRELSVRGEWPGRACSEAPFVMPLAVPTEVPRMGKEEPATPNYPPTAATNSTGNGTYGAL